MKTESKIRFLKIACKTCGMDFEEAMEKAFMKKLEGLDPETRRALERAVEKAREEK